jgi:hypothetical protein
MLTTEVFAVRVAVYVSVFGLKDGVKVAELTLKPVNVLVESRVLANELDGSTPCARTTCRKRITTNDFLIKIRFTLTLQPLDSRFGIESSRESSSRQRSKQRFFTDIRKGGLLPHRPT